MADEREILELDPTLRRGSDQMGSLPVLTELGFDDLGYIASPSTAQILTEIANQHFGWEIRPEQVECLDALEASREAGNKRALVHMATGLGKTSVIAADVKRYLKEQPQARVLFLCHQNRILDQAKERFQDVIGPDHTYGTFTGEDQQFEDVSCWFASFQMMRKWYPALKRGEFQYIVVDESHHAKAGTYEPILRHFQPEFLVGITGTPDRHDVKDRREIFGPETYSKPLAEALAEGLLTDVDYSILLDQVEAERLLRDEDGNKYSIRQLNRKIFVPHRDREIVRICEEKSAELNAPTRRLVFCASIEQTEEYAQYFENSAPIHTKLPPYEIKRALERFRKGELQTLLTVDMFNEGIDVPEVNQLVFLRLTQSKNIFLQQLGRGLRKLPEKDKVQALDFVANGERLAIVNEFWQEVGAVTATSSESPFEDINRITIPHVHFDETTLDIFDVLDEIEGNSAYFRHWSADDSITFYTGLSEELGRPATIQDIADARAEHRAPPLLLLLRDFDRKIMILREACGIDDQAPEGWYSMAGAANVLGITDTFIKKYVGKRQWQLPVYRFGAIRTGALNPEQFAEIAQLPNVHSLEASEDTLSLYGAARALSTTESILKRAADVIGITLDYYRFGPRTALGVTQEQISLLKQQPQIGTPAKTEDEFSIKAAAKVLGVDYYTLKQIIENENVPLANRKTRGGQIVGILASEQIIELRQHPKILTPNAPEEILSIPKAAELVGVSPEKFKRLAQELGLEMKEHKFGSRYSQGIHFDEVARVSEYYEANLLPMPETHVSVNIAASDLNMYLQALNRLITRLGFEVDSYKGSGGQRVRAITLEQLEVLRNHPFVTELNSRRKGAPPKTSKRKTES